MARLFAAVCSACSLKQASPTPPLHPPVQLARHQVEGEWRQLLYPHNGDVVGGAQALALSVELVEHLLVFSFGGVVGGGGLVGCRWLTLIRGGWEGVGWSWLRSGAHLAGAEHHPLEALLPRRVGGAALGQQAWRESRVQWSGWIRSLRPPNTKAPDCHPHPPPTPHPGRP
jgi:hypothetical protein